MIFYLWYRFVMRFTQSPSVLGWVSVQVHGTTPQTQVHQAYAQNSQFWRYIIKSIYDQS